MIIIAAEYSALNSKDVIRTGHSTFLGKDE